MKRIFLSIVLWHFAWAAFAQTEAITVFKSGTEGYKSFRIPAIISLPNGDLLAFCEGRVKNAGDFGHVNIVMKHSADKGKTWSSIQTVAENGNFQAGNAAPVVDVTDPAYPKGRIFLFYNTGNNHEGEVRKGNGLREVWYKTSTDNGKTWSDAVNITTQTHRPKQPAVNAAYNFAEDWRSYANTPGHAMQFAAGQYKGRIFIAANHSEGNPQQAAKDYRAHGFYTDDHGKTFHISNNVDLEGGNENMAAEISGGRLMLNLRNQQGHVKARYTAISEDGGQSWKDQKFDRSLPDPVCQGSILTIGSKGGKNILAFCNAADERKRDNLTLRISYDDGKTWNKSFVVYKNPSQQDAAAYSDIVKLSDKKIGVLYEKDNYSQIVFAVVKWR
ncbi:MAG: exo-alpha-sialidase [Bacteroidetes bacterium]|nr:exo-alpha-sialidase [Bacteroidota bacterium]MBS1539052.1 exo-alpha-sialidase [Bacteroidota bacterium]